MRLDVKNAGLGLLAVVCVLLGGCSDLYQVAKVAIPEAFGMERIADGLYVEPVMTPDQRGDLAAMVATARQRMDEAFGAASTKPAIVACVTAACFKPSGGPAPRGLAFGTWAMLLAPRGVSTFIITHEWSHIELRTRLAGAPVPTWFDEGLAVALSDEPLHSEAVWRDIERRGLPRPDINRLRTPTDWNAAVREYGDIEADTPGSDRLHVTYATAGHDVRDWLRRAGTDGLRTLITRVRTGEDFKTAFRNAASRPGESPLTTENCCAR